MNPVELQAISHQTSEGISYTHVHIQITSENGVIVPSDLNGIVCPGVDLSQGVVIEGKAPIWLYAYLIAKWHLAIWVGTYDPRLGVVVVSRRTGRVSIGDVLNVELPNLE